MINEIILAGFVIKAEPLCRSSAAKVSTERKRRRMFRIFPSALRIVGPSGPVDGIVSPFSDSYRHYRSAPRVHYTAHVRG